MRTVCVQRVSKALFIRTLRWETRCVFATSLRRFSQSGLNFFPFIFYGWTGTSLRQRKHNECRACALLVHA